MPLFKKIKDTVAAHSWAVVLALIVTILVAFPQVYFRIEHRDDGVYQGIELLPDSPWSPRVREVQDGYLNFGSMYWKEGKSDPYLFQPLGSIVWGYIGKIFFLDTNNTMLVSRILMTFTTVLLGYTFVFLLSRDKIAALASVAVVLLADSALSVVGVTRLLSGISPEEFLSIGKPVHNTMIYIPFFGFLIAFFLFYKERKLSYGILSAIILGLNFYNYFYTWTYLYAFCGILAIILFFQKKWDEALRIVYVMIGGLVVGIFYIINLYKVTLHPLYHVLSMRIGVIESHAPIFVGGMVIGALVLFFVGYARTDKSRYWFVLALLLAPFLTLNQQIVVGKIMQVGHYHWYFHKPIAIIIAIIVLFTVLAKTKYASYRQLVGIVILTISIGVGTFIQVNSYVHGTEDGGTVAIERQKYGPVVHWLFDNAQKDAVVLGNDEVSHVVTIYTPQNVFFHRGVSYSALSATDERLRDMVFTFYRLRGVGSEDVDRIFHNERGYIAMNLYHLYYRDSYGSDEAIPDEKINELIADYKQSLMIATPLWLEQVLTKYEVSYIVWDKHANPDWQLNELSFLKPSVTFGDLTIYQVSTDTSAQ